VFNKVQIDISITTDSCIYLLLGRFHCIKYITAMPILAPTTAPRAHSAMRNHQKMKIELQLLRYHHLQMRLRLLPASLFWSPAPNASKPIDMRVNSKRIPLKTPAHNNRSRLRAHAFVADKLLHSVLVAFLEKMVEVAFTMSCLDLLEYRHDELGLSDMQPATPKRLLELLDPAGPDGVVLEDGAVDGFHAVHCSLGIAPAGCLAQDGHDHCVKDMVNGLRRVWVGKLLVDSRLMLLLEYSVRCSTFLMRGMTEVGKWSRRCMCRPCLPLSLCKPVIGLACICSRSGVCQASVA